MNPLNGAYCVGNGLNVDQFGRPTWTRTLAGQWSSGIVFRPGLQGTGLVVVSNLLARITNTAAYSRELMVRAQSNYCDVLNRGITNPQVYYRYGVGASITEGITNVSCGLLDGFNFQYRVRWPGSTGGPTFVTLGAGASINVAMTFLAAGTRADDTFDVQEQGMLIEAHWLGG